MKQLTKKQAIALYKSGKWKNWTDEQIVRLQLFQDKLCVDWSKFHGAVEKVLDRSVFTHEFGSKGRLREEYLKKKEPPTMGEIFDLLPKDKTIVVITGEES